MMNIPVVHMAAKTTKIAHQGTMCSGDSGAWLVGRFWAGGGVGDGGDVAEGDVGVVEGGVGVAEGGACGWALK